MMNDFDGDEPQIIVREAEYSFMPPVRVDVIYDAVKGTNQHSLHLTWQAAHDLYMKLGDHLKEYSAEEI